MPEEMVADSAKLVSHSTKKNMLFRAERAVRGSCAASRAYSEPCARPEAKKSVR